MREQELREKIKNTILEKIIAEPLDASIAIEIASALIEAGIGDVSELQKECDSKEEAYNKCYFDYKHWKYKAKEYKHRAEKAESALMNAVKVIVDTCEANPNYAYFYNKFLQQAEEKLQEE